MQYAAHVARVGDTSHIVTGSDELTQRVQESSLAQVLQLLRDVAEHDVSWRAIVSRHMLQNLDTFVPIQRPGPCSALCWDILALQAKTSPEATEALHEHVFCVLGTRIFLVCRMLVTHVLENTCCSTVC
jgi:hypothetical protein